MLIVLSPSKTLDFETLPPVDTFTQPDFLKETSKLVALLKKLSVKDIRKLMEVSEKIATLNHGRYNGFSTPFTPDNAKQAVLAFKGDVYDGLNADAYQKKEFTFAQDHLRILSGLYGLLRPLDLIQPYRLEMGIKLKNPKGKDLYHFWDKKITQALNDALAEQGDNLLINLTSNEYFKAVKPGALKGEIITPVFKEKKGGQYKVIGLLAKKARGMMADYIIRNRVKKVEDLKGFDRDGYCFNETLSRGTMLVFTR